MARKISDRERLIAFVLNATEDQLREAKELVDTALRNKQPRSSKAAKERGLRRIERKHFVPPSDNPPSEQ